MDPKEIEGTPERAADRGREVELGYVVTDKPSLGNPDVVRGLVSEFASGVVGIRRAWIEGKDTDPAGSILKLATEYGDIIMGRDERYASLPWNNPARLGRRIGLVTPPIEGVEDPGAVLFVTIGTSLSEIAAAHEQGRLPDSDAERHTKVMLEDAAALIVGTR